MSTVSGIFAQAYGKPINKKLENDSTSIFIKLASGFHIKDLMLDWYGLRRYICHELIKIQEI